LTAGVADASSADTGSSSGDTGDSALAQAIALEADTHQRLIDELKSVKDEMKALNANAKTLNAVGYREALKFMADSISGQVVGTNLQGRRQTAGNGRVAITP
jgi:tRNA A37 N6-isopentenylltransferase MiaA